MWYETELLLMHRFKWLEGSRFVICDIEGNERILNIDKNYEEESYNAIPLFNEVCPDEWKEKRYYHERGNLEKDET